MSDLIKVERASFGYGGTVVLEDVNLSIAIGSSLALLGPSGSGKSTILAGMAGMLACLSGRVLFEGTDLSSLSAAELTERRLNEFGFVFQRSGLLDELSLLENVALPARLAGTRSVDALSRAEQLLGALGVGGAELKRLPSQVSGGQEQRAAVARALINSPKVVFADEPTGALDEENSRAVADLLVSETARNGAALVMVTHNTELARGLDAVVHVHHSSVISGAL